MSVVQLQGALYKSFRVCVGIVNTIVNYNKDGIFQIGTLAISGTAEKYKTTTVLYWRRLGIQFTKAATDNLTFGTAYTVNTGAAASALWGAFLIEITDTGTVSAVAVSSDQVYATEALAIAALPDPTAGSTQIGYITVNANTSASWTADTDDLTDASDCLTATFYDTAINTTTAINTMAYPDGTPS